MSFQFKEFFVEDGRCAMKVGTDSVLLGAWCDVDGARCVVDAGAGCGLLSLMVAQRNRGCTVVAVELDGEACADCRANFAASPWSGRLSLVEESLFAYSPECAPDLIVSNPPFFTETLQSPDARRASARHAGALGPLSLISYAAAVLSPEGRLCMVTPASAEGDIAFAAGLERMNVRSKLFVVPRRGRAPQRILWELSRVAGPLVTRTLELRDDGGDWTGEYARLVEPFYLRMPRP